MWPPGFAGAALVLIVRIGSRLLLDEAFVSGIYWKMLCREVVDGTYTE